MGVTPDRAAGPSDEEELQLEDRTADGNPTVDGAVRFVDGSLRIKTAGGVRELGDALKILGKALSDTGISNDYILRYVASSQSWVAKLLGDAATIANIMQLLVGAFNVSLDVTYTSVISFVYGGSDDWGTLNKILLLTAQTGSSPKTHDLRVYDATNGLVVAEKIGSTHQVQTVVDLGTVSNVPTAQASFEIQVRRTGGGQLLDVHAISMQGT